MLPGRRRARLAAAALLVAASAGLARADDGNCPIIDFTCGATNKDANSSVSPSWCRAVNPWLIAQVRQRCRARGARVRAESTQRGGAARLCLWECMLRVCGRRTRSASRHLTCFLPSSFRPRAQPPTNLRETGDDGSMARGVYKSRYSCGGAGAGMLAGMGGVRRLQGGGAADDDDAQPNLDEFAECDLVWGVITAQLAQAGNDGADTAKVIAVAAREVRDGGRGGCAGAPGEGAVRVAAAPPAALAPCAAGARRRRRPGHRQHHAVRPAL